MKINLRVWMFIKVLPYMEIFLFYILLVHGAFTNNALTLYPLLVIATVVLLFILKRKLDTVDEFARKLLNKADAICLKGAFVIMFLLLPATIVGGEASGFIMGELISGSICLLSIIRAIIFLIVDMRGMGDA